MAEDTIPKKRQYTYNITKSSQNCSHLSIASISFNNNNKYVMIKLDALINLIKKENINIIFISNLSYDSYTYINDKIDKLYHNVQVFKTEEIRIGTVLFLRKDIIGFDKSNDNPYYFDLENSSMERKIIGCEIRYAGKLINIIGICAETNLENEHIRTEQINILSGIIKDMALSDYIIVGNFESEEKYPLGNDVWIKLGCSNILRANRKERIYYTSENMEIISYTLIGITPCADGVSDSLALHSGILCSFSIN